MLVTLGSLYTAGGLKFEMVAILARLGRDRYVVLEGMVRKVLI